MIFVITGTERYPFDRFIREIDTLKQKKVLKDEIFVQLGACAYEPEHCNWQRFLSFHEMAENIKQASLVIAHAGAGTTLLCLHLGKRPVLVTRRKRYNEHVDDHQVPFAQNMEKLSYAIIAYEVEGLEAAIAQHRKKFKNQQEIRKDNREVVAFLNEFVK